MLRPRESYLLRVTAAERRGPGQPTALGSAVGKLRPASGEALFLLQARPFPGPLPSSEKGHILGASRGRAAREAFAEMHFHHGSCQVLPAQHSPQISDEDTKVRGQGALPWAWLLASAEPG